ncbi:UNVERIFIED_CONTAM: hypothetical protein GTU68_033895 [Idotea baltica]|nr:hypothetical protein [Idotea baltica]
MALLKSYIASFERSTKFLLPQASFERSKNILVPHINYQNLKSVLRPFSCSTCLLKKFPPPEPKKWLTYNEKVFPPQEPGEEPRPAFVCHMKSNIKYSYKKMWYIAVLARGLSVDDALNQLKFINKMGAITVADTIKEARTMAVQDHNVEFPTKLWVAESFVGKGYVMKGMRRHARTRMGEVRYQYNHYFVRLEEGDPPKDYYYWRRPLSVQERLDRWLKESRERTINFAN